MVHGRQLHIIQNTLPVQSELMWSSHIWGVLIIDLSQLGHICICIYNVNFTFSNGSQSQHGKKKRLCDWVKDEQEIRNGKWRKYICEDVSCHYLYLRPTQPQPQTVFAQIQNTDLPEPFISFFGSKSPPFLSGLDQQQLNNLRCLHWFWNLPLDPLASPFPSFIVPFPIPSPNLGLLWLLAHLGDSLSIICHHQCSGGQSCGLPCNYCAHRSVPH